MANPKDIALGWPADQRLPELKASVGRAQHAMPMRRRPSDIPEPPHRTRRREPLPSEHPRQGDDDAASAARLRQIMEHPAYRQPDRDVRFLHTHATRGVRLQLDYLKAEQCLEGHGVHHCIVVFGSTRLRQPEDARRELASAREAAADAPKDPVRARQLRLAEHRLALSRYYEIGRELGRLVGAAGRGAKD